MAGRGIRTSLVAGELLEAQRLVRAKRKIQEARIPYEVPPAHRLGERLASVQAVVYLIFNEGYSAVACDQLVRRDLCLEAIRLGRVLCDLLRREPENIGLLALMLLYDSRRDARISNGQLVTLEEQDRSLCPWQAIALSRIFSRGGWRRSRVSCGSVTPMDRRFRNSRRVLPDRGRCSHDRRSLYP